jgi:hypothetical protein
VSCGCGKKEYDKRDAEVVAARLRKAARNPYDDSTIHAYHCPESEAWHVGHKGKRMSRFLETRGEQEVAQ